VLDVPSNSVRVVIQKEKEVLNVQEMLKQRKEDAENVRFEGMNLDRTVDKYEETLSQLINEKPQDPRNYHHDNSTIGSSEDVGYTDDYNDSEEYILDESMDELNEDASVSEEIKPNVDEMNSKVKHKTRCTVCRDVFFNKAALQAHQGATGHIVLWDCDMCDKKFKTKSIAQIHKTRIHSTVMPFKCGKCEKRFKDQGSCRRHEANDSVHIKMENVKLNPNLMCNVCGKEFDRNRRWCLDQHLLTHLANKKFSCEYCGQFYRQKAYLQTHMKVCKNNGEN